jgi:CRP-like cAMP-binding protein
MYIVAAGSVEVFIQGLSDSRSLVVLGKGQVIGEMALIDQGYRSASVRSTKEGATLYLIESDSFYSLCAENNHIGFIVMRNLAIDLAFKLRHRNLAEL